MQKEPLPPDLPDVPDKNQRIRLPGNISTPEQGCFGCAAFALMITLSVGFWIFMWWRTEPSLHLPAPMPRPTRLRATPTPVPVPASHYNNQPIPQNLQTN